MNSNEIQAALVGYRIECLWTPMQVQAFRNIKFWHGETDLLIIQKSGAAWEIEIKVSVADFRREFITKKEKHEAIVRGTYPTWTHRIGHHYAPVPIQQFYFAMPLEIYEKVKDQVPEYAGIITFPPDHVSGKGKPMPKIIKKAKKLGTHKVTGDQELICLRSWYYRHWDKLNKEATAS